MHVGIDFGAQKAGTTAICYVIKDKLHVNRSMKGKNADVFLEAFVNQYKPTTVFIDAPLSLPGVYFNNGDNYFYRQADIELEAMSPMFLGGLTARAMRFKSILSKKQIECHETYPKEIARKLLTDRYPYYKSKEPVTIFENELVKHLPYPLYKSCENWHEIDSILAWLGGFR